MDYTLTVLDTGGIQDFIFGSNELRENAGASELVYRTTRHWAFEALEELFPKSHNVLMSPEKWDAVEEPIFDENFHIEEQGSEAAAEVIYAGGGNTVVLFGGRGHENAARDFVYRLGRRVLRDAPGLNLYAAHEPYYWKEGGPAAAADAFPEVLARAMRQLNRRKAGEPPAVPLLAQSVTAHCASTGLPAHGPHPGDQLDQFNAAHRQVGAKWAMESKARERLRGYFPDVEEKYGLRWTVDLDRLANLPERNDSYIAVIHADGNGIGRRIQRYSREKWESNPDPRAYIGAMRELSTNLEHTATRALREVIYSLCVHLRTAPDEYNAPYFPLRPIVFGGDDVTLVCAGPWGVAVAHRYLAALEKMDLAGEPPYAAAGVAIVKTHYPFSQAYALSSELADEAKERVFQLRGRADKNASALDWHYTTTGLTGSLDQIRRNEYLVDEMHTLLMRPVTLHDYDWRNWDNFVNLVTRFQSGWLNRRNKVLRLRTALRGGRSAVHQFETLYEKVPAVDTRNQAESGGWVDEGTTGAQRSSLYDAVEMLDMFYHLPSEEKEEEV